MGAIADGVPALTTRNPISTDVGAVVRQVGIPSADAAADGMANPTTIGMEAFKLVYNDTTWDRERSNINGTALADATRTTGTADSGDIINYVARGAQIVLNYSTGTANMVLRVLGKDALSSAYYTLMSTGSISATGAVMFEIYPGVSAGGATTPATGGSRSDVLPRTWRVTVLPSGSVTAAYSVGYSLIR